MPELAALALLAIAFLVGLALIPLGLPGLWLMVLSLLAYAWYTGFGYVGWLTVAIVVVLALIAEGLEAWLSFRFAKRYGASNRAGWGAMAGGLAGAFIGTPIPLIGSIVGAFLGAFIGAALFEYLSNPDVRGSLGAGWGAILGRAAGAAVKVTTGIIVAVIGIYSALV